MNYPMLNIEICAIAHNIHSRFGPGLPGRFYGEYFKSEFEKREIVYDTELPGFPFQDNHGSDTRSGQLVIVEERVALFIKGSSGYDDCRMSILKDYLKYCWKRPCMVVDFSHADFSDVINDDPG